jgi:hypothetical protein
VKTPQLARLVHPAGVCDDADLVFDLVLEICDPLGFVGHVEPALQLWIVRGNPGRAGVLVTL